MKTAHTSQIKNASFEKHTSEESRLFLLDYVNSHLPESHKLKPDDFKRGEKETFMDTCNTIMSQAFKQLECVHFQQEESKAYEKSLQEYHDLKNGIIDTDEIAGGEQVNQTSGKLEQQTAIAHTARNMGLSTPDIAKLTGLSEAEIEAL